MATFRLVSFLVLLLYGIHTLGNCEPDNLEEYAPRRPRPPPPRRNPPPPPRRSPPPPPRRSPPPPPRRSPPPPPRRSPPPPPRRSPPPPPRRSPPPPPRRSPPPPPRRSPPPPPRRSPPPPPRRSPPPPPLRSPPPPPRRSPPPPPLRSPPPPPLRSPPPPPGTPPPPAIILPPPPPSGPPPGFDYFILALTWPNAFCKQQGETCDPSVPPQRFTIHGLWPQKNDGSAAVDCATTDRMTNTILDNHRDDLLEYWPALRNAEDFEKSKGLWRYQWYKHGSCSSNEFDPAAYLTAAINLGSDYGPRILEEMENEGINPDGGTPYTYFKVLNAIHKVTGTEARLVIKSDRWGQSQLLEIRLCVDKDGITLQDCATNNPFIFASAPDSARFPNLLSTSILEVEEAVGL